MFSRAKSLASSGSNQPTSTESQFMNNDQIPDSNSFGYERSTPADSTWNGSIRISNRFQHSSKASQDALMQPDTTQHFHEPSSTTTEFQDYSKPFNNLNFSNSPDFENAENLLTNSCGDFTSRSDNLSSNSFYPHDRKNYSDGYKTFYKNTPTSIIHHPNRQHGNVSRPTQSPFNNARNFHSLSSPKMSKRNDYQLNPFNQNQSIDSDPFFEKFTSLCIRTKSPFVAPNLYPFSQPKKETDVSNPN